MALKKVSIKGESIFVGQGYGPTVRISVPANSEYDFKRKETFIDLPLMDKEDLENWISALMEMRVLFEQTS